MVQVDHIVHALGFELVFSVQPKYFAEGYGRELLAALECALADRSNLKVEQRY